MISVESESAADGEIGFGNGFQSYARSDHTGAVEFADVVGHSLEGEKPFLAGFTFDICTDSLNLGILNGVGIAVHDDAIAERDVVEGSDPQVKRIAGRTVADVVDFFDGIKGLVPLILFEISFLVHAHGQVESDSPFSKRDIRSEAELLIEFAVNDDHADGAVPANLIACGGGSAVGRIEGRVESLLRGRGKRGCEQGGKQAEESELWGHNDG